MRITPQRDGVRGTHTLPYHKLRPDLLRPSGQLALSDFRIKIVSPDDDLEIRSQIILQMDGMRLSPPPPIPWT